MIGYIEGVVIDVFDRSITVKTVSGVGYELFVTAEALGQTTIQEPKEFFVHTHVREQDISLFGFTTQEELRIFRKLITVSGIGPKTALDMLATPYGNIVTAIETKDITYLTRLPGIGKKTAERLALELQGKLGELTIPQTGMTHLPSSSLDAHSDIIDSLLNLGYEKQRILRVLEQAPKELDEEELVRYSLKHL